MRIVGFGRIFTWAEMGEIPGLWQLAGPWLEAETGSMTAESFGAMFVAPEGTGDFGYIAGIDMAVDFELTPDLMELRIQPGSFAIFPHNGGLADWPKTIWAVQEEWLPSSGHVRADLVPGSVSIMERYGPGFDPQTGLGDMQCWLPLKS
jgi:AraC family transcriptional regulator